MQSSLRRFLIALGYLLFAILPGYGQVLDKSALIRSQTYFDNQDWDWFERNIPFFDCPDPDIVKTYYYRWELLTKHLTYGNPDTGYLFTEFIDRPFWSGAYGAISCPAGHQLYEARWLRSPRVARDYSRYWVETPGAQPRNYSTWLADSVLAVDAVHPDPSQLQRLLPKLIENFEGWKRRHYDESVGLFWQTGHDDGMEFNIASRQTQDILRGAPSYRPSFNAYMWADARAISEIARRNGNTEIQEKYEQFAEKLRQTMLAKLWDPKRKFFFPMFKNDENRDGYQIAAGTLVYEQGRFAGDSHGRELIGYVPWQFRMLDQNGDDGQRYEEAWAKLMDRDGFYAEYGPSTVERNDPMFLLQKSCCWWSGQSWPYATTQTLKALANLLQKGENKWVRSEDYVRLLQIYARSHRKDGRPYLAEALHPDTGSFEGHDGYNHSEHYFHSGYCDLVITGLVGLQPGPGDQLRIQPLAPSDWEYFALDGVRINGRDITILWDREGTKYNRGKGLVVLLDGTEVHRQPDLKAASISMPSAISATNPTKDSTKEPQTNLTNPVNHVVNNDGSYFPRITATSTRAGTSISKLQDGNYWYLQHPPNRWESDSSESVTIDIDFGVPRSVESLELLFLNDSVSDPGQANGQAGKAEVMKPVSMTITAFAEGLPDWNNPLEGDRILAHRPTRIELPKRDVSRLRIEIAPQTGHRIGLTEIQAWGAAPTPYPVAPPPGGNLAYRAPGKEYPKASASHSDRFGGTPDKSNDGKTVFNPNPLNRWTSYESTQPEDWLEIDLGEPQSFNRMELAIYDDRGGVQAPESYAIQYWRDGAWQSVSDEIHRPEKPAGSQWNEARFGTVTSSKVRVLFRHKLPAKSGVTEIMLWNDHLSNSK